MKFDIVTIFPRMVEAGLTEGVVSRAVAGGVLDVRVHDLRDYTSDRHRSVDDMPYGGGPGMGMKPGPLAKAGGAIRERRGDPSAEVLLSGHHAEVRRWRKRVALRRTLERRPDLLATATLDEEERELLNELKKSS